MTKPITKKRKYAKKEDKAITVDYKALLVEAITVDGVLSDAYTHFHNYSIRNKLFLMSQLLAKGLNISPVGRFLDWKRKGRSVKSGESALYVVRPIIVYGEDDKGEKDLTKSKTLYKPVKALFSFEQTEGEDGHFEVVTPLWDKDIAMQKLNIVEVPFGEINGNIMGYAMLNTIAINPTNPLPHKTLFHEMAHVVLGHTSELMTDGELTPKNVKEVEAEGVAYILTSIFNLDGKESSRAYLQGWLKGEDITKETVSNIFNAVDTILDAGKEEKTK